MISASDENTYDSALSTWNGLNATVKSAVGRVNVHGYQYGGGRRDLLYSATTDKKLWNSEYGEGRIVFRLCPDEIFYVQPSCLVLCAF